MTTEQITLEDGKYRITRKGSEITVYRHDVLHHTTHHNWAHALFSCALEFKRVEEGHFASHDAVAALLNEYITLVVERRHRDYMHDNGTTQQITEHENMLHQRILMLMGIQSAMTVINPDEWEPCSPEYLSSGGSCKSPRVWNADTGNHWHPKLIRLTPDHTFDPVTMEQVARPVALGPFKAGFDGLDEGADYSTYGITHIGAAPSDTEKDWINRILVYGDAELRDHVLALLNEEHVMQSFFAVPDDDTSGVPCPLNTLTMYVFNYVKKADNRVQWQTTMYAATPDEARDMLPDSANDCRYVLLGEVH